MRTKRFSFTSTSTSSNWSKRSMHASELTGQLLSFTTTSQPLIWSLRNLRESSTYWTMRATFLRWICITCGLLHCLPVINIYKHFTLTYTLSTTSKKIAFKPWFPRLAGHRLLIPGEVSLQSFKQQIVRKTTTFSPWVCDISLCWQSSIQCKNRLNSFSNANIWSFLRGKRIIIYLFCIFVFQVKNFIDKNKDTLRGDVMELLIQSRNDVSSYSFLTRLKMKYRTDIRCVSLVSGKNIAQYFIVFLDDLRYVSRVAWEHLNENCQ